LDIGVNDAHYVIGDGLPSEVQALPISNVSANPDTRLRSLSKSS
jgi:hypothetical protein